MFSERLKKARELRKMSQAALSAKSKIAPSVISLFEANKRKPSFDNLKNLADALDVTTDYLMGRADDTNASSSATRETLYRHYHGIEDKEDRDLILNFVKMIADKKKG